MKKGEPIRLQQGSPPRPIAKASDDDCVMAADDERRAIGS
jgi:hypothetical protein